MGGSVDEDGRVITEGLQNIAKKLLEGEGVEEKDNFHIFFRRIKLNGGPFIKVRQESDRLTEFHASTGSAA